MLQRYPMSKNRTEQKNTNENTKNLVFQNINKIDILFLSKLTKNRVKIYKLGILEMKMGNITVT